MISPDLIFKIAGYVVVGAMGLYTSWKKSNARRAPITLNIADADPAALPAPSSDHHESTVKDRLLRLEQRVDGIDSYIRKEVETLRGGQDEIIQTTARSQSAILNMMSSQHGTINEIWNALKKPDSVIAEKGK